MKRRGCGLGDGYSDDDERNNTDNSDGNKDSGSNEGEDENGRSDTTAADWLADHHRETTGTSFPETDRTLLQQSLQQPPSGIAAFPVVILKLIIEYAKPLTIYYATGYPSVKLYRFVMWDRPAEDEAARGFYYPTRVLVNAAEEAEKLFEIYKYHPSSGDIDGDQKQRRQSSYELYDRIHSYVFCDRSSFTPGRERIYLLHEDGTFQSLDPSLLKWTLKQQMVAAGKAKKPKTEFEFIKPPVESLPVAPLKDFVAACVCGTGIYVIASNGKSGGLAFKYPLLPSAASTSSSSDATATGTAKWLSIAPLPLKDGESWNADCCAVWKHYVYVIGDSYGGGYIGLRYNTRTDKWVRFPESGFCSRSSSAMVCLDNHLWRMGGQNDSGDETNWSARLTLYDDSEKTEQTNWEYCVNRPPTTTDERILRSTHLSYDAHFLRPAVLHIPAPHLRFPLPTAASSSSSNTNSNSGYSSASYASGGEIVFLASNIHDSIDGGGGGLQWMDCKYLLPFTLDAPPTTAQPRNKEEDEADEDAASEKLDFWAESELKLHAKGPISADWL